MITHRSIFSIYTALQLVGLTTEKLLPTALLTVDAIHGSNPDIVPKDRWDFSGNLT